jgi:hypothetical protein
MSEKQSSHSEEMTPREKVEQMQGAFDTELDNILEELQVWNFRLATAYAEDKETGEETHLQLALAAKNELDEQWSYYGDWVMVSGLWDVNRPEITNRGIIYNESIDEPIFGPVMSNGFEIEVNEDSAPVAGFSFKVSYCNLSNKYMHGNLEVLAFARPEKAAFSFARKAVELESPKEQLIDAVHYYDGLLQLYTHQPSDFYRKPARVQQQFFEKLIDDLTETITAPPYVTLCQYAEVPYVYRRGRGHGPNEPKLSLEYIQPHGTSVMMSGTVKGVTILDTLYASDQPLRSKEDLIDADAGICFIVAASEGSLDDEQVDERDFIIPSRLIKDLDIVIK